MPSTKDSNSTQIDRHVTLQSSLSSRVLYPLWSFLKHRYKGSAETSLQGYRFVCQQFAGELDAPAGTPLTRSKIASRLKDFALHKRPHVLRAQAGSNNANE